MKLTEAKLRQIIRSVIKEEMINEGPQSNNVNEGLGRGSNRKSFGVHATELRNRPGDHWKDTHAKILLHRKISSALEDDVYRFETDNWFRRYVGTGKGEGLMIRKLEIANIAMNILPITWLTPHDHSCIAFNALITYLPTSVRARKDWHPLDDAPINWKTTKGLLILGSDEFPGKYIHGVGNELVRFVNRRASEYIV